MKPKNNNFNTKIPTANNSKNQIATTINTIHLNKEPVEIKNAYNKNNNQAPNALPANKLENKFQKNNQEINPNTVKINNNNNNNLNHAVVNKINPNKNNKIIIEEKDENNNNKKEETPLFARNYRNAEINLYRNYISENKWSIQDFEIGKKLGSGRFGKVYLVKEKKNNFICALKTIFKSQIVNNNLQPQIRRELEIHSHLENENILKFYGFFWDDRRIFLILEYAPGGEIYKELQNSVIIF